MRNLNIQKIANVISVITLTVVLLMPVMVAAQFPTNQGLPDRVDTANTGLPQEQKFSDIIIRIIQILLALAGLVAVVFLIIGGFRYITAGGNEESAEAAKTTITNAIIGIVVIILSFVIVRVISNALTKSGPGGANV